MAAALRSAVVQSKLAIGRIAVASSESPSHGVASTMHSSSANTTQSSAIPSRAAISVCVNIPADHLSVGTATHDTILLSSSAGY